MSGTRPGLLRRDRDYRWFWMGQTVSVFGTQVTTLALPLAAALSLGAGAGGVSVVATASYLPNVLLPLFAGNWLERRRRRRIMILADVVRAVALAVVPLAYATGRLSLGLLAAVAFVVGAASVVFDVGGFAYVPSLVEDDDLPAANRAMQGSVTAAQVGGPGLAGLLVQLGGPARAVGVDAVSYLASVFGLAAARRPEPQPEPGDGPGGVLDGLRQILVNPFLRALTAHAALYNAAAQILIVNLVVWAVRDRGASPGIYGLALSAGGAGAFLGTMLALHLAARLGYGHAFATSLLFSTGLPLLIPVLPFHGVAFGAGLAVLQFASGAGLGSANVLSVTLRQVVAPRGSLARTNGGYRLLIYGVIPAGSALGGVLGQVLGSRAGAAIGAAGLAISALPMMRPRIRSLRDPKDARQRAAEATER
jgi:predicted MFS family arabinose efflux permease